MDKKLIADIEKLQKEYTSIIKLQELEVDVVLRKIRGNFNLDTNTAWCWQNINGNSSVIDYSGQDGLDVISDQMKKNAADEVILVVTDDEPLPWEMFRGNAFDILEIIGELRFFEYHIIDSDYRWVVFDTHQNQLITLSV